MNQVQTRPEDASTAFDQQGLWHVLANSGQVVAHDDQGSALGMPGMNVFPEKRLTRFIEGSVRLIEQQQGCVREAQTSKQGTLQFAAGQGHQWALFQTDQVPTFKYGFEALPACLWRLLAAPETRGHQGLEADGKLPVQVLLLWQKESAPRRLTPSTTLPASGFCKPAMTFSRLLLPEPLAPVTAVRLPEANSKSIGGVSG